MSPEQAFLQAIRERPWSNAPRLMYADWLTERGDPRGEFIRLQCDSGSRCRRSSHKPELQDRGHDLLLEHEQEWLGSLLGRVNDWEWRRGMLDWVAVNADVFLESGATWWEHGPGPLGLHLRKTAGHVTDLAKFPAMANVTALYLGQNGLTTTDFTRLIRSPHLEHLTTLMVHGNEISAEGVRALTRAKLPRLRELHLGHNPIRGEGLRLLAEWPGLRRIRSLILMMVFAELADVEALLRSPYIVGLRHLMLDANFFGPGLGKVIADSSSLRRLRSLNLDMNRLGDEDAAALASSTNLPELTTLGLGSNEVGDAALTALANSQHLPRLRALDLHYTQVGEAGVRALARSTGLPRLRWLSVASKFPGHGAALRALLASPRVGRLRHLALDYETLTPASVRALANAKGPCRLRELSLPVELDSASLEALASSSRLASLQVLSLGSGKKKTARGLAALFASPHLSGLRELRLNGTLVGDAGLRLLAQSPLLGRLRVLDLGGAGEGMTAAGLAALAGSPLVAGLTRLDLGHNDVGAEGVRALASGKHWDRLTELDLSGTRIGPEGARVLADWPLLGRLRRLELNANAIGLAGSEALAASPHIGPLLRVNLSEMNAPYGGERTGDAGRAALRRRMGGRVAFGLRTEPRVVLLGGGQLLGQEE